MLPKIQFLFHFQSAGGAGGKHPAFTGIHKLHEFSRKYICAFVVQTPALIPARAGNQSKKMPTDYSEIR